MSVWRQCALLGLILCTANAAPSHRHASRAQIAIRLAPEPLRGGTLLMAPFLGPLAIELQTGTPFDEKAFPRRHFASPYPELRGAGLLILRFTF